MHYKVTYFPKTNGHSLKRVVSSDFEDLEFVRKWCEQIGKEERFQVEKCEFVPQEEYL